MDFDDDEDDDDDVDDDTLKFALNGAVVRDATREWSTTHWARTCSTVIFRHIAAFFDLKLALSSRHSQFSKIRNPENVVYM